MYGFEGTSEAHVSRKASDFGAALEEAGPAEGEALNPRAWGVSTSCRNGQTRPHPLWAWSLAGSSLGRVGSEGQRWGLSGCLGPQQRILYRRDEQHVSASPECLRNKKGKYVSSPNFKYNHHRETTECNP